MAHFLVITDEPHDSSTVYGIFDTFDAARKHVEERTENKKRIEEESKANRKKSGTIGDPGPYVPFEDYGINWAQIQEWQGTKRVRTHERDYLAPLNWLDLGY